MVSATNIDAKAVNTIAWLSDGGTSIVVPVYQRQYRWDIGGCEQLLADVRAVAASGDSETHFIGSILSTKSSADDAAELVLIDGQQRITTLMLLIAALQHTVRADDAGLAAELGRVLVRADDPTRTKLRPHSAWADVFESVILDRPRAADDPRDSRFDDNYAFFRSQILAAEAPGIWRGLQKLEHVAIALSADANAQQTFESPQLHRRAAPRSRADPQLRADGPVARRAATGRGVVLGAHRAERGRLHRKLLAALPRHDDGPRGRHRR